jgi:hypothetical protein
MTIRRLDAFFRTQVTLDQPRFFNSVTNLALAPLQRLVGQNHFESLKGKVSYVPEITPAAPPSSYVATLFKVVVFVCHFFVALVLTPIGIAARHMSFRSPQIDRAYSHAFLLSIDPLEQTPELMEPAFAFMQKMAEAERNEFIGTSLPEDLALWYLSLPAYRSSAYAFLSQCPLTNRNEIFNKLPPAFQGDYLALDANAEFSKDYLREVTESEYSQLMPHLSFKLIKVYQAQQVEKTKKHSLDKYLTTAIQSLEKLEAELKAKKSDQWVSQLRNDPMYPFPFYLVQALENNPTIVARADTARWERFQSLRQSCLEFLSHNCDDMLLKITKEQANQTLSKTFKSNISLLIALKKKLESTMETSELKEWIELQRCADNYSYPFYTHPSVLKLMSQNATAEKLRPFSESFSTCLSLLQERGLEEYINEKPSPDHGAVNALMRAMDQLENISKLQDLIKTQTA